MYVNTNSNSTCHSNLSDIMESSCLVPGFSAYRSACTEVCLLLISSVVASVIPADDWKDGIWCDVAQCSRTSSHDARSNCVLDPINVNPRPVSLNTLPMSSWVTE